MGGLFRCCLPDGRPDPFLESHPREWVDRSDAAYNGGGQTLRLSLSPRAARERGKTGTSAALLGRLDLNDPPTAVGGILLSLEFVSWLSFFDSFRAGNTESSRIADVAFTALARTYLREEPSSSLPTAGAPKVAFDVIESGDRARPESLDVSIAPAPLFLSPTCSLL